MKKKKIAGGIWDTLRVALRYARQHAASSKALEVVYTKQLPEGQQNDGPLSTLVISRYGSVYKVVQRVFNDDGPPAESQWMATYGWHSNGHLIEIGGDRYLVFDPLQKCVYLENFNDPHHTTVEVYHQI